MALVLLAHFVCSFIILLFSPSDADKASSSQICSLFLFLYFCSSIAAAVESSSVVHSVDCHSGHTSSFRCSVKIQSASLLPTRSMIAHLHLTHDALVAFCRAALLQLHLLLLLLLTASTLPLRLPNLCFHLPLLVLLRLVVVVLSVWEPLSERRKSARDFSLRTFAQ